MPAPVKAQTRREANRRVMVEATERLLARGVPYTDLTIEQIACEAGLSRTSFYFAFRDKRELLEVAASELAGFVAGTAERWLADPAADREQLEHALRTLVRGFVQHGALLRAVVEAATYDSHVSHSWRGLVGRYIDATQARRRADATATGAHAEILAASLVWMTERTAYQLAVKDHRHRGEALVTALTQIWWQTLNPAANDDV